MVLPRRLPKKEKQSGRWRSQAHCNFLRSFACCACDSGAAIEVSHIRLGTDAGMGRKPSDYFALPLCKACHNTLHTKGERSFYAANNIDPLGLAEEFIRSSPKRSEIERVRKERHG